MRWELHSKTSQSSKARLAVTRQGPHSLPPCWTPRRGVTVPQTAVFALGLILSVTSMLAPAAGVQAGRVYRVGILSLTSFEDTTLAAVTIGGLAKLGYVVGENIVVDD